MWGGGWDEHKREGRKKGGEWRRSGGRREWADEEEQEDLPPAGLMTLESDLPSLSDH